MLVGLCRGHIAVLAGKIVFFAEWTRAAFVTFLLPCSTFFTGLCCALFRPLLHVGVPPYGLRSVPRRLSIRVRLVSIMIVHHWSHGMMDKRIVLWRRTWSWGTLGRRRQALRWLQDVGVRAVLTSLDWLIDKGEAVCHADGVGMMAIAEILYCIVGAARVWKQTLGIWLPL